MAGLLVVLELVIISVTAVFALVGDDDAPVLRHGRGVTNIIWENYSDEKLQAAVEFSSSWFADVCCL